MAGKWTDKLKFHHNDSLFDSSSSQTKNVTVRLSCEKRDRAPTWSLATVRIRSYQLHKGYEMLIPKAKCDVGPCNPSTAKAEAGGPRVQGPLDYKANLSQQSN